MRNHATLGLCSIAHSAAFLSSTIRCRSHLVCWFAQCDDPLMFWISSIKTLFVGPLTSNTSTRDAYKVSRTAERFCCGSTHDKHAKTRTVKNAVSFIPTFRIRRFRRSPPICDSRALFSSDSFNLSVAATRVDLMTTSGISFFGLVVLSESCSRVSILWFMAQENIMCPLILAFLYFWDGPNNHI